MPCKKKELIVSSYPGEIIFKELFENRLKESKEKIF